MHHRNHLALRRTATLLAALSLSALSLFAHAEMPRMELTASFHRIEAEVAANQANREQGLMFRKSMAANQGMLFVFPQLGRPCMWMRNTLMPLSVAFIDDNGNILNIEDMKPETDTSHCAVGPARFALEMNLGWFAGKGLKPGLHIGGLDKSPRPQ